MKNALAHTFIEEATEKRVQEVIKILTELGKLGAADELENFVVENVELYSERFSYATHSADRMTRIKTELNLNIMLKCAI